MENLKNKFKNVKKSGMSESDVYLQAGALMALVDDLTERNQKLTDKMTSMEEEKNAANKEASKQRYVNTYTFFEDFSFCNFWKILFFRFSFFEIYGRKLSGDVAVLQTFLESITAQVTELVSTVNEKSKFINELLTLRSTKIDESLRSLESLFTQRELALHEPHISGVCSCEFTNPNFLLQSKHLLSTIRQDAYLTVLNVKPDIQTKRVSFLARCIFMVGPAYY